jgi:hypothetical protein
MIQPRQCFSGIKYSEKVEILPIEKYTTRNKTRLFAVVDGHVELMFRVLLQKAMDRLLMTKERTWKVGFSIYHRGVQQIYKYTGLKDICSLDGSSFDSSLSIWLMVSGLILLCKQASYSETEICIVIHFFVDFILQPRFYYDIMFATFGALPSGFLLTAMLNCYVVEFLMSFVYPSPVTLQNYISYGDDIAMKKHDMPKFVRIARQHGVDYEPSNDLSFLSFIPEKTIYGLIARPKCLGKCYSMIAYIPIYETYSNIRSIYLSLFFYYFFYFYFDQNAQNNFVVFHNMFSSKFWWIRFFEFETLFKKALRIWFLETEHVDLIARDNTFILKM